MTYLLDTNVVSELRRVRPHGAVLEWLSSVPTNGLFVSAVTFGELQAGVERLRPRDYAKADEIEHWLEEEAVKRLILLMCTRCFRRFARLTRGRPSSSAFDAMIAATALVHDLVVATRDTKDFVDFGVATLDPFAPR